MALILEKSAFDRGVREVAGIVFPDKAQAILDFKPSEELQLRIAELADKSNDGSLTEAERAEYEGYVRANKFIAILQRLARQNKAAA